MNAETLAERLIKLEINQAKIITKLEANLEHISDNIIAVKELLERHDATIYGQAQNNGLRGRVSKLEHQVGTAKWFVGIAASVVAGVVSFIASILGKN